jgi:hypothetical protein
MQAAIHTSTIRHDEDVRQVLALQQANLPANISAETAASQGFVTVQHNFELLKKMNDAIPQVIARDGENVVGYALVMLPEFQEMIPVLQPMFAMFDRIEYRQRKIATYDYYVMGQVCVAEGYRGTGIFDQMYLKHRELYSQRFDFCITEIAARNVRSQKAHERVGFKTIHTFEDETDLWNIVLWNWQ